MKKKVGGMTVKDEIKGISVIYKLYHSRDVAIFYIDVNTVLKGVDPCWFGHDVGGGKNESWELVWFDPYWKSKKGWKKNKIKMASIDFGKEFMDGWTMVKQSSRYSTFVVFYKKKFMERAADGDFMPIYQGR